MSAGQRRAANPSGSGPIPGWVGLLESGPGIVEGRFGVLGLTPVDIQRGRGDLVIGEVDGAGLALVGRRVALLASVDLSHGSSLLKRIDRAPARSARGPYSETRAGGPGGATQEAARPWTELHGYDHMVAPRPEAG
jgi:hypothetical protein